MTTGRRSSRRGAWIIPLLGVLLSSCGKSPIRPTDLAQPAPIRALVLDLSLSDSKGSREYPLTILASVRNVGSQTVAQLIGNGMCKGIRIEMVNAAGESVVYTDPCAPQPVPLCGLPSFEPGASQTVSLPFVGDTYRRLAGSPPGCALVDAPTGTYTVIVRLRVYWNAGDDPAILERSATFDWTGP